MRGEIFRRRFVPRRNENVLTTCSCTYTVEMLLWILTLRLFFLSSLFSSSLLSLSLSARFLTGKAGAKSESIFLTFPFFRSRASQDGRGEEFHSFTLRKEKKSEGDRERFSF